VLGCTLGLWGAVVGTLAGMGKGKRFVLGSYWVMFVISLVMLVAGVVAFLAGQPYGVWYGLGLAGLIGTMVLGANGYTIYAVYRRAEQRKMCAENL
jgi:uncharacterized membrane-anchored protein